MLFAAEITADGWVMISGAVFLGLTKIVSMVLDAWRAEKKAQRDLEIAKDQAARDAAAAVKVEAVRVEAAKTAAAVEGVRVEAAKAASAAITAADSVATKLDEHGEKMDTLVVQTNGMSERIQELAENKGRSDQKEEDRVAANRPGG